MKFFSSPLLFLLVLSVWISVLFTVIDAQQRGNKKQNKDPSKLIRNEETVDIDRTENNDRNDDVNDDPDRFPGDRNNRTSVPAKKKPSSRENDGHLEESDESLPPRDRKRKHGKKDKHMKKHKDWRKNKHWKDHSPCRRHGKHHPACEDYRMQNHHDDHDHHHHHHHHQRHRRPSHRRHGHSDEDDDDEVTDYDRTNRGRGEGHNNRNKDSPAHRRGEKRRKPKVNDDDDTIIEPTTTDRNNNVDLEP